MPLISKRQQAINIMHENISSVLFTTHEFTKDDAAKLVDELVEKGVMTVS